MKQLCAAVALAALSLSTAHAGLLGSSVSGSATLGINDVPPDGECKTATFSGLTVGAGPEVVTADYTGFCSGAVDIGIDDTSIVLTGVRQGDVGDYDWLVINLAFTGANPIDSVSLDSLSLFQALAGQPTPIISFTSDSISIVFDFDAPDAVFELENGGQAILTVSSADEVPAPAAFTLFGLGVLAAGARRRRG